MADQLAEHQKAFLLLQLLGAEEGALQKGEANKALLKGGNQALGMNKAEVANQIRDSLCPRYATKERGKTDKGGTTDFYRITDEGKAYLLGLPQYPKPIQISGLAINRLLEAARQAMPSNGKPAGDLPHEILRAFRELRRERYGQTGLVPIHEVRRLVAERVGPEAARHDPFDHEVMNLWRRGHVRPIPINDMSRTTTEQLNDSIPGSNVTWFYLEAAS